ncbi:hypothetical protein ERJ75_001191000 [Trypanosoma vivax]|uniref:Uncharacterized protein n=1 Tax=Trypanosoma vivax (strain Y486) TaxID=1055687 RepID=G0UBW8_TRYVY|nr:hypothetical protein TRVL_06630 [Trypanosoma vivax]KAH8609480.1 hypothetical protein ERJ75_001191600 [Trypanosoma vivax]KAH8609579.1 hypothetical protein ERJ75_001191000 [Trypanosoma vivax]CCC53316.1 conserved hypothetical protein [Trypanosoma vivax Y486]
MEEEDPKVRVLHDPTSYAKSIVKEGGARWVQGLAPIDLPCDYRMNGPAGTHGVMRHCWGADWLRLPILFGAVCLLLCILDGLAHSGLDSADHSGRHPLDFPMNEEELWAFARRPEQGLLEYLGGVWRLWAAPLPTALFSLALSWKVGLAAQDLVSLCGVGVSLLALVGTLGQLVLLWFSCSISSGGGTECDTPFVLFWCLGVARTGAPLLAVWFVAPALDILEGYYHCWKMLLAVPLLVYSIGVMLLTACVSETAGDAGCTVFNVRGWSSGAVVATWSPLLLRCLRWHGCGGLCVSKPHSD